MTVAVSLASCRLLVVAAVATLAVGFKFTGNYKAKGTHRVVQVGVALFSRPDPNTTSHYCLPNGFPYLWEAPQAPLPRALVEGRSTMHGNLLCGWCRMPLSRTSLGTLSLMRLCVRHRSTRVTPLPCGRCVAST